MSDEQTIAVGRKAWEEIRRTATIEAWLRVGRALLVGRKICMTETNVDIPRGIKYVKRNCRWLDENGFRDLPSGARACAMLVAENETAIVAWLDGLPAQKRPMIHPRVVWQAYRLRVLRRPTEKGWRERVHIDEDTALAAWEDARIAGRDAARCQPVSAMTIEMIARAVFVTTLKHLSIAVPQRLVRDFAKKTNGHAVLRRSPSLHEVL